MEGDPRNGTKEEAYGLTSGRSLDTTYGLESTVMTLCDGAGLIGVFLLRSVLEDTVREVVDLIRQDRTNLGLREERERGHR